MVKPLAFYRTNSVIQITPDTRRGVLWIDGTIALPDAPKGAPEKGVQKFNWEEKLIIVLSPEEGLALAECAERVLRTREGKVEFFHDPKKGGRDGEPKTLSLSYERTEKGDRVFIQILQGAKRVSVALGKGDLYALATLIPYVVSRIWDWTGTLPPHEEEPSFEGSDDVPF